MVTKGIYLFWDKKYEYNGKKLPIGTHLDFYTPELLNDLISEFLEVN